MLFCCFHNVFRIDFKHIQDLFVFVIFCQYTEMSTEVRAKAGIPARGGMNIAFLSTRKVHVQI